MWGCLYNRGMKPLTLTFFIAAGLLLVGCSGPSAETATESSSTATATLPPTQPPPTDPPPTATDASLVSAEPATPTPLATEAAVSPTDEPTPTEAPTISAEVVEVVSGQLPSGAFFLGDVDAPVTLIDYSDFL